MSVAEFFYNFVIVFRINSLAFPFPVKWQVNIGCHATVPQIWLDRGIVLVAVISLIAILKGGEEFTRLGFLNLPPRYCPYMHVCFIIRILFLRLFLHALGHLEASFHNSNYFKKYIYFPLFKIKNYIWSMINLYIIVGR